MTQIILSLIFIISAFVFSITAQTAVQQNFNKGIKSATVGKYETALGDFQKSLTLAKTEKTSDSFLAKIHFNIGVCFYQLKAQAKAVTEYERAILLDANYEKAFYALGMAQAELKNWQAAEKAFLGAIRLNNRNGETWFDLAFVYLAQENYQSAKEAFQKSIKLKSVDSAIGHNNLGVILAMDGDFDSAIKEFETALRESNGNLTVAERNLQFCKTLEQNFNRDLVAKLEFGK